jgi:hypothetical protein
MGELRKVDAYMIELVEPAEAAQHDPPLTEWFKLPEWTGDGISCPSCGSTHFGTVNPRGYLLVRHCSDEFQRGCTTTFRTPMTLMQISELIEAFNGIPRRFGMGKPRD